MPRLIWNDALDRALVDAFLVEYRNGNKVDGWWTVEARFRVADALSELVRYKLGTEPIKRRMSALKMNFKNCYKIFDVQGGLYGIPGFTWNPITEMIEAESRYWDELMLVTSRIHIFKIIFIN